MSDYLGTRIGMRGRLWWLFFCQMTGSVMCVLLGIGAVQSSLANTIGVICVFSFFIEAACGATYGIYPFVSHRALGVHTSPVDTSSYDDMLLPGLRSWFEEQHRRNPKEHARMPAAGSTPSCSTAL